ncbi:MAG: bifunctional UDP-N-acetylglucosamine diphosphorylase/glucosamine-1-phosphate N-acetyltransferase GlmU [Acidobacteria bacterium]|nr:bifunctional UDP-N-acetylglucosamine diphosphorylase/glucosamine-1-phosphate N-acetyltransferase GlmU [Acidobacteriota bacterium]MCA1638021.1 bifunctional UDP-N-acetylglucosamine diphosphorylase/glucosamine-1-phosphate N-acetyltransferase GlmU [Acidobacteriota bacterium]
MEQSISNEQSTEEKIEQKIEQRTLDVLVLAAGLGTRMRSDQAKVLHELDGRALINHVCRTATALAPRKIYVVIGHQGEDVKTAVLEELDNEHVEFVWQKEQLGTGDAVNAARQFLETEDSTLLILSGDVPMIRAETLAALVQQHHNHRGKGAACTLLTVKLEDPTGYGRIVRDEGGVFQKIVEQKDANPDEKTIKEINAGIYCFDTKKLFAALSSVKNNNAQGEYYLTDVPGLLRDSVENVSLYQHTDAREVSGINNRVELADLERTLCRRTVSRMMLDYGVTFIDPKNVYISERANIGRDTIIYPNVSVEGETEIGDGCTIRSGTRITNSRIGRGVKILDNCVITDSEISDNCAVGPFAHLRGKAKMEESAKVGNFVELKKTVLGRGSKASHLTYLGDATIGERTNIGAGTITCNYDGKNKHSTIIEDNVKIGSDTMLVAPVRVGSGSVTGAGSVVTKDVPPDSLVAGVPAQVKKNLREKDNTEAKSV